MGLRGCNVIHTHVYIEYINVCGFIYHFIYLWHFPVLLYYTSVVGCVIHLKIKNSLNINKANVYTCNTIFQDCKNLQQIWW